jgi:serine protease Do
MTRSSVGIKGKHEGAGVIISAEGHVITAHHVSGEPQTIRVQFCRLSRTGWTIKADGTATAKVVDFDKEADIALLKLDPTEHRIWAAKIGVDRDVVIGSQLYRIGNDSDGQRLATGHVYAWGIDDKGIAQISMSTIADFGCSGGPVFDRTCGLIGISLRGEMDTANPTDVEIIPYTTIYNRLLKRHGL